MSRTLWGVAAISAGLAAHAAGNPMRTPPAARPLTEKLSLCLPLRNEAHRVEPCLRAALRAVEACDGAAEFLVLDDDSSDGTPELVRSVGGPIRLHTGRPLQPDWLGKPHACLQLSELADPASNVLVYLDADVVLAPDALLRTVALLRDADLDLVSPYPRQRGETPAERLVQPLLQWSWLNFLPLHLAESSTRPSLSAANGQLMAVDRAALARAGGFAAVKGEVLDDIALVRAIKAAGGRGGVADGTDLAACRMYDGWAELRDGYSKSLWSAFGSPAGALAVNLLQLLLFTLPAGAALTRRHRRAGLAGYAAGVAGRVVAARRTGGRAFPDAAAHPLSIAVFAWLSGRSVVVHSRHTATWKGRLL